MAASPTARTLFQDSEVFQSHSEVFQRDDDWSQEQLGALNRVTFADKKWDIAVGHLQAGGRATEDVVRAILLEGAQSFGCWRLSDTALDPLVRQVMGEASDTVTTALASWVDQSKKAEGRSPRAVGRTKTDARYRSNVPEAEVDDPHHCCAVDLCCDGSNHWAGLVDSLTLRRFKWGLAVLVAAISVAYGNWVVFVKYQGIIHDFGWPIILARAGGMGTAIFTALLFLSMAKTFLKQFYRFLKVNSVVLILLDGHKDLHVFFGQSLGFTAVVHVLAHLMSTVPSLKHLNASELNAILACANRDAKLRNMPSFAWLQWPKCPFETGEQGWSVITQSTPGVSGLVLIALLFLVSYTARNSFRTRPRDPRDKSLGSRFDLFWYVHNTVLVLFPVTMFIHGSNQWIGVGFPLVAYTASVPILLYLVDRVRRFLRFYVFGKSVMIAGAVVRPGKGGGPKDALTHLAITKPTGLWNFSPGMYAFVNMPDYARHQWHPFTICSGKSDSHVEFIIQGVGDWTQELASRCLAAQDGKDELPRIRLDGPYAAPTQSALSRPIFVAVGAGVGITPFLSLMSSIISLIEESSAEENKKLPLKEAHFFWMTRSIDEFLFGRRHFARIQQSERLRKKVYLHLHTTAREEPGNAASYLFRQAVKRQSKIDKAAFKNEFDPAKVFTSIQMPACWMNQSELDVMWMSDLVPKALTPSEVDSSSDDDSSSASDDDSDSGRAQTVPVLGFRATTTPAVTAMATLGARVGRKRTGGAVTAAKTDARGVTAVGRNRAATPSSWVAMSLSNLVAELGQEHRRAGTARAAAAAARAETTGAAADEEPAVEEQLSDGEPQPLVPVVFGRPDFEKELRAIGGHWGAQYKVHIYICGNDLIVKGLEDVAATLNDENVKEREDGSTWLPSSQKYVVSYERFG